MANDFISQVISSLLMISGERGCDYIDASTNSVIFSGREGRKIKSLIVLDDATIDSIVIDGTTISSGLSYISVSLPVSALVVFDTPLDGLVLDSGKVMVYYK